MKTILMTMTAVAALAVAAPAAAEPWSGHNAQTSDLQLQIDAGMRSGAISRREAMPLQRSLRDLVRLERQFSPGGFSGRENAALRQRSNTLSRQIRMAERNGAPRASWEGRNDRQTADRMDRDDGKGRWGDRNDRELAYGIDPRFDRPNRGDRFAGDARVGHHTTFRMLALPEQYRDQFRDNDEVYYRYDDSRIYRINRRTDMILGLFDI